LVFTLLDGYEDDPTEIVTGVLDLAERHRELLDAGELSKQKPARELDTPRRTINRALDRPELYFP
jgi:hypothetical protein